MTGLSLEASASGPGISCNHGGLWLDRVRLERGNGNPEVYGLNGFNCQVHVRRSVLTDLSAGGVEIKGDDMGDAGLSVENSYFTFLGSTGFGAIRLAGKVDASLLYTTIAINQGQGPQLDCVDAFAGALAVRNTVVIDPDLRIGATCLPFLDGD